QTGSLAMNGFLLLMIAIWPAFLFSAEPLTCKSPCKLQIESGQGHLVEYSVTFDRRTADYQLRYFEKSNKMTCETPRFTFRIPGAQRGGRRNIRATGRRVQPMSCMSRLRLRCIFKTRSTTLIG